MDGLRSLPCIEYQLTSISFQINQELRQFIKYVCSYMLKSNTHSQKCMYLCVYIHTCTHRYMHPHTDHCWNTLGTEGMTAAMTTCPAPQWHCEGSLGSFQWAIKECNCKPRSGGRFPQGCPRDSQLRKCSSACERNNMRSRVRQGTLHWVTWARLTTTALSPASQHQLWCQSVNSSLSQPCSSLHVSERREGRKDGLSCSLLKCSIRAWALMYL